MTQSNYPPQMPPGGQPVAYGPPQSNGFAIASLVCSILGFCVLFLGGLLGIVFGILGLGKARQTGTGKGLATAGLIIGILSLLTSAVFSGMFYFGARAAVKLTEAPRAAARQYVTDLSTGNVDKAATLAAGPTDADIAEQSKALQLLGSFKDMTSSQFNITNNICTLDGIAQFSNGTKRYHILLINQGTWKVQSATFQ